MTGFGLPRFLAAIAALCAALAPVYPLIGYGWQATGGLVCVAVAAGWVSHDLARHARWLRAEERAGRRVSRKLEQRLGELGVVPAGEGSLAEAS